MKTLNPKPMHGRDFVSMPSHTAAEHVSAENIPRLPTDKVAYRSAAFHRDAAPTRCCRQQKPAQFDARQWTNVLT